MIPKRTITGTCEISTAALTLTSQPPAFQGEGGALQVQIDFTLDGSAFLPDSLTQAQLYLYYPSQNVMTAAQNMTISGNTATATLSAEDQATPGAPYLVVQMIDTSSGALIVSCMSPIILRRTRADALTDGTAPNPSEVVYVGRAPYIGDNEHWMVWDNDAAQYVDSGIDAVGPQGETGPQGPKGDKGDKGDTGATPEITIGTVTTGAPGTEAAATMTGTPEAPVLSLTIPRGLPGEGDVSSVAGVMPDEDGDVPLSAADVGAYPDGGIRSLTFSIASSAWAGAGPYTYTITDSGVTANTWCTFELTGAVQALLTADIAWTTSAGQIALSTQARPAGTLSGTILLMEVS